MRRVLLGLVAVTLFSYCGAETPQASQASITTPSVAPFTAFTGKILRNKVRLRLQPSTDSKVLREFSKDDLVIVLGEADDFYIVKPPEDTKAYVFRTFILDDTVEGKNVNVRSEPDLEAPILAQLNSGEKVQGTISTQNSKWLQIAPPESTRFYIAKDYVEKIGDPTLLSTLKKRRVEVNTLLDTTFQQAQEELAKPYEQIQLEPIAANYTKVFTQYTDFPTQAARAKELLSSAQDTYLHKKLAYLEGKANAAQVVVATLQPVSESVKQQAQGTSFSAATKTAPPVFEAVSEQTAVWIPAEKAQWQAWSEEHPSSPFQDYMASQKKEAVFLVGVIEPYTRPVRNKPGDYLLIDQTTRLPNGYLYSTVVDLQKHVGQEVILSAVPRPDNNFAHPAFYVLTVE